MQNHSGGGRGERGCLAWCSFNIAPAGTFSSVNRVAPMCRPLFLALRDRQRPSPTHTGSRHQGRQTRRLNSPQRSPQGDPYRSDKRPVGGKPRPDWRVTAELKDQEEPGLGRGARRASWTEGAETRGPQGGELGPCPARKEPPAPAPERRLSRSPCAVLPPRVHSAELQGPEWEPELCPPPPSHPRCPLLPPARGAHHTRNKTSATTSRGKAFCHPASVLAFHHFTTS